MGKLMAQESLAIDLSSVDPWMLPFVSLEHKTRLPHTRGIYFCLKQRRVLYIGKAERDNDPTSLDESNHWASADSTENNLKWMAKHINAMHDSIDKLLNEYSKYIRQMED